ncbi:MAG TPA: class I SAM-dependent methyltransferase [Gaiellaceae bacterium]|jgi:SAM-dependent methyltransferase|nr:class I SAM-dependent methyltransferase [Gaiellaceae bacterium]
MSSAEPGYVAVNREHWTRSNQKWGDAKALDSWRADEISWGVWGVPESEVHALPDDLAGLDVVELGCGVGYFSAWLARRGARPVGVDPTPAQLASARRCMAETGIEFPLVEAYGEDVPLPDAAFDLVLSEYGASIWADPYRWIPEASRLVRPGGVLVFLRNSTLAILCSPDAGPTVEKLVRPQFGMHRFDWSEDGDVGVDFHLAHGDWVRLLRANRFELLDLIELQAPADAVAHEFYDTVPVEWAKQWPSEEIWVARKAPLR